MDRTAIKVGNNHLWIQKIVDVGTYRGEDSGAIYHEYEPVILEFYDLTSILEHTIKGKTIRELIAEDNQKYPYAGELFTSEQATTIYCYLKDLPESTKEQLRRE